MLHVGDTVRYVGENLEYLRGCKLKILDHNTIKNTYDVEKSRRISYIGMGSMPTQTTALRNRIINF